MSGSSCPNCKRFVLPNSVKCAKCGFNVKEFFRSNYYVPVNERSRIDSQVPLIGLPMYRKILIFLFPFSFFYYNFLHDLNDRQFSQGLTICIASLISDFILGVILYILAIYVFGILR